MKQLQMNLVAILLLAGCTQKKPDSASATMKVWDGTLNQHLNYQLQSDGQIILEALLARKPNIDTASGLALDPSGVIMLDGVEYWIEPDMIALCGNGSSRIWNQIGIRKKLIQHSSKLEN